jgi:hypothetical protein
VRCAWLLFLGACGESLGPRPLHYDLGSCGVVDILDEEFGEHVPQSTVLSHSTNPPASGPHYGIWARYDFSYPALERGFWLHNVEHGAIALLYRCDEGCPAEVAALEDVVRGYPVDPACSTPVKRRALVASDPLLPDGVPFAAIAWGVTYTATCVDPGALEQFRRDFYAKAPEDFCTDGAGLGGTPIE